MVGGCGKMYELCMFRGGVGMECGLGGGIDEMSC